MGPAVRAGTGLHSKEVRTSITDDLLLFRLKLGRGLRDAAWSAYKYFPKRFSNSELRCCSIH